MQVWRRQLVIPFLKKKAISYYDPQRSVWSENMIYEESIAKERSSLFLFVIDPATVNATSFLEIAYFAARKSPKLVVVFLGKTEWKQKAHPDDLPDRNRTCLLLDRILDAHDVPMLYSIQVCISSFLHFLKAFLDIPIYFILVPLLLLSLIVIVAAERWQRYRARRPRAVADSSYLPHRPSAAIPSPRMPTVVTPINFVHENRNCKCFARVCVSNGPPSSRRNLRYSSLLVMSDIEPESRMKCLVTWASQLKHFFYLIPSTKTFLSGMVEVAYILGHTNWQVTICVPKHAEALEAPPNTEDELERASRRRRNDCYQIAFCYLKMPMLSGAVKA
ncbi:unnamed protein product [Heligmosomoides polygyrus]|uniref:Uncharacterized protein n=1 Tax=Heligmosomoides polygyrus TaxID=6339 RepID=A0A3P7WLH5_HELPZ|nr:unnamed protein product [Heligmosomoides polygyrus]